MDRRRALQKDSDDLRFSDLEENSDAYSDDDEGQPLPKMGLAQEVEDDDGQARVPGMRHLREMKSALGLDAAKAKADAKRERKRRAKERKKAKSAGQLPDTGGRVQTNATRLAKEIKPVEVVEYSDRRKRKNLTSNETDVAESSRVPLTMKQARFDVFKFGVSGFQKEEREDAEVAALVQLGAKPPKKEAVPYAELKEERKKQKKEEKERQAMQRLSGVRNLLVKKKGKDQDGKNANKKKGKQNLQSKVGNFDGGMLKLSAKDLATIKGKK